MAEPADPLPPGALGAAGALDVGAPGALAALDAPAALVPPAPLAPPATVDGTPPMPPLPERRFGERQAPVVYRFPERPLLGVAPPFAVDLQRRARAPLALAKGPRRTAAALGEAAAPDRDFGFAIGEHVACFLEGYAPYMPSLLRRLLPVGLRALEWLPLLLGPRRRRLSRLDVAARRAFLERVERGPPLLRDPAHALLGLVKCAVYDHPAVHAAMGYAPQPFVDQKVRERRERFGAPEVW